MKNWLVRLYDKDESLIREIYVLDRTESQAEKEIENDVNSPDVADWTMTETASGVSVAEVRRNAFLQGLKVI